MGRKKVQVVIESYKFKFAVQHDYYQNGCFHFPYNFTLPKNAKSKTVREHFIKMRSSTNTKVLLVSMYRPSNRRLYAFSNWLRHEFLSERNELMKAGMAFGKMEKDMILQHLDCYGISEEEYSYERARKSWNRFKKKNNGTNLSKINFNELRSAPNRQYRGNLQSFDFQNH